MPTLPPDGSSNTVWRLFKEPSSGHSETNFATRSDHNDLRLDKHGCHRAGEKSNKDRWNLTKNSY